MYQHADQAWQKQPVFMPWDTVQNFVSRLEEHAKQLDIPGIMVVAHGGEPLLYPFLDEFFDQIRKNVRSTPVMLAVQTNGTLFTEKNLDILRRHQVRVGVSVDGSRDTHNRERVRHNGRGTYDDVLHGVTRLRHTCGDLFDSILQVIDPTVPAEQMIKDLEAFGMTRADLLFPQLNHDTIKTSKIEKGEIGEWLVHVFDIWCEREETVHLRIFEKIIHLLLGGVNGTDQLGAQSAGALMIETDGSYEIYDGLRTTYEGASYTGFTLDSCSIEAVENLPLVSAFRDKSSAVAPLCLDCRLFSVCGGGSPVHRYSSKSGFLAPSVYCDDLKIIIDHIAGYMKKAFPHLPQTVKSVELT